MKPTLLILAIIISIGAAAQIPTGGMMAGYTFDGNANDASGNGNNGTVYGATLTNSRTGTPNAAYHFNGTSDYITVPNSASLTPSTDNISMCVEVKIEGFYTGPCQGNTILNKNELTSGNGQYSVEFTDNAYDGDNCSIVDTLHETFVTVKSDVSASGPQLYTPYINKNQWYCVICTFDGDSLKTYIDGVKKVAVYAPNPIGSNTGILGIGRHPSTSLNYWFHGVIDDIHIYNRVLTNTEIQGYCSVLAGVDEAGSIASHVSIANLANGVFELKLDKAFNKVNVTVSTALGQTVYSSSTNNSLNDIIDLSSFAKGVYLVNVVTEEGMFATKIVRE
jgi:hypothetical protein